MPDKTSRKANAARRETLANPLRRKRKRNQADRFKTATERAAHPSLYRG